ncbi:MAG: hypothetical protein IJT12_03040 [Paludibacteraceae bacterium]|nr:hypothetical protein [Paludibacteraceae bacterium]
MTQTFNFKVKGRPFSFSLEVKKPPFTSMTYVVHNIYRPEICEFKSQGISAIADMGENMLSEYTEFTNDLNFQVSCINDSREEPSAQVFFDACCAACNVHIWEHGRLLLADMFIYLDIYAILLKTCFGFSTEKVKQIYYGEIKILGKALYSYIKCPDQYGVMHDFNDWAKSKGLT